LASTANDLVAPSSNKTPANQPSDQSEPNPSASTHNKLDIPSASDPHKNPPTNSRDDLDMASTSSESLSDPDSPNDLGTPNDLSTPNTASLLNGATSEIRRADPQRFTNILRRRIAKKISDAIALEKAGVENTVGAVGAANAVGAEDTGSAADAVGAEDAVSAVDPVGAEDAVGAAHAVGAKDAIGAEDAVSAENGVGAVHAADAVGAEDAVSAENGAGAEDAVGAANAVGTEDIVNDGNTVDDKNADTVDGDESSLENSSDEFEASGDNENNVEDDDEDEDEDEDEEPLINKKGKSTKPIKATKPIATKATKAAKKTEGKAAKKAEGKTSASKSTKASAIKHVSADDGELVAFNELDSRRAPTKMDFEHQKSITTQSTEFEKLLDAVDTGELDWLRLPEKSWPVHPGGASNEVKDRIEKFSQSFAFLVLSIASEAGISKQAAWKLTGLTQSETRAANPYNLFCQEQAAKLQEDNGGVPSKH
jgi:hypothetical protein